MSFLNKIFGSDRTISKSIDLIDNIFYTDQEKAEQKKEILKAYEPFKLAQRYLALIFAGLFSLSFIAIFIMSFMDMDYSRQMKIIEVFNIDLIMITIVAFYFGGGVMNSLKKNKNG